MPDNSGSWDADRTTAVDNVTALWAPTNYDTLSIGYNQRFLISDPRRYPCLAYQVSKIEDTQPIGLTKFKLTQETFNPITDNAELMLADYYKSRVEPTPNEPNEVITSTAAITYSGVKPTIKVGGSFKTFTPAFSDESATVAKWTISDEGGDIGADTENYTIVHDGDKLKLKVALNYNLIGKVLIVQVFGSDGSTAEQSVEVI